MRDDPAIAQIREVRHRISAQFGHDPKRLIEHYVELQERHKDRLVRGRPVREQLKSRSAGQASTDENEDRDEG